MKQSTKDQIKGTAKQIEGGVKKQAGKAMGRRDIEDNGRAEQVAGTVQKKVGQIKKVFGK
ncbi:MAG: CsbD family protein [Verrucomicrobiales bacterium]|nr:CsbD family protein [Verrucomicrobiales bacterium]